MADDLGYETVSFTEHHFHIEGSEVSNNSVLLDLYFAMQTIEKGYSLFGTSTRSPATSKRCAGACRSNGCSATLTTASRRTMS